MQVGDKVAVIYRYGQRRKDFKVGRVVYISKYKWVTVRFPSGYCESFWVENVGVM
jgi:hypothetical protein